MRFIFCSRWRSRVLIFITFVGVGSLMQSVLAVPVTLRLDNRHQTIARPASGTVVVNFTGTVSFGSEFEFEEAVLDIDYNCSSTNGLPTEFGLLNFSKADMGEASVEFFLPRKFL